MSENRVATNANGVRPGDVRMVNDVRAVVVREDLLGMFCCVPLKDMSEHPTGNVVIVEAPVENGCWDALPEFAADIFSDFIGDLVCRLDESAMNSIKAGMFWWAGEKEFSSKAPNSEEDWALYHQMSGPSMERFLSRYADTYVFEDDGTIRHETKKERRSRLARRRRAMKKKGVWHKGA